MIRTLYEISSESSTEYNTHRSTRSDLIFFERLFFILYTELKISGILGHRWDIQSITFHIWSAFGNPLAHVFMTTKLTMVILFLRPIFSAISAVAKNGDVLKKD
jgi:hypothetical protein